MKYNTQYSFRCDNDKLEKFKKWCIEAKIENQELLREVIQAIPEGRLTITKEKNELLKTVYKGEK